MYIVFTNQCSMEEEVVDYLKIDMGKRNIRDEHNTTSMVEYFQGGVDLVINYISKLEGKGREETTNDDDGRNFLYDSGNIHLCGEKTSRFMHSWMFTEVPLNGLITIWHMGSIWERIPTLKLF